MLIMGKNKNVQLELADLVLFFFLSGFDDCFTEPVFGFASSPKPLKESSLFAFLVEAFFDFFLASPLSAAAAREATSSLADFLVLAFFFFAASAAGAFFVLAFFGIPSPDLLDFFDFGGIFMDHGA